MKCSEQINELAAALAKAQGEIEPAPKDKINPHFKSRYADLASIMDACRGPLAKHGLALIQPVSLNSPAGTVRVTTRLLHASGQWIEDELEMIPKDMSPQAMGSVITYGRRYGVSAMLAIVSDDDDDGNAAQPRQGERGERQPPRRREPVHIPEPFPDEPETNIFIGTDEQAERVEQYLLKAKVPRDNWHRIGELLMTKRLDQAAMINAVATVHKEVAAKKKNSLVARLQADRDGKVPGASPKATQQSREDMRDSDAALGSGTDGGRVHPL